MRPPVLISSLPRDLHSAHRGGSRVQPVTFPAYTKRGADRTTRYAVTSDLQPIACHLPPNEPSHAGILAISRKQRSSPILRICLLASSPSAASPHLPHASHPLQQVHFPPISQSLLPRVWPHLPSKGSSGTAPADLFADLPSSNCTSDVRDVREGWFGTPGPGCRDTCCLASSPDVFLGNKLMSPPVDMAKHGIP